MRADATVFVVDDEPDIRRSLCWLVESIGLRAEPFASAREFLDTYDAERAGCLLLDVRLRGGSGFDLLAQLGGRETPLPVIMMTAYGDFLTAVRALKGGATDIFEKPFNDQEVLDRIGQAIASDRTTRQARAQRAIVWSRLKLLTPRERTVLDLLTAGKNSKVIAGELNLGMRTVEHYRTRVLRKMEVASTPQLVGMVLQASNQP